jgi:hypothetical protein
VTADIQHGLARAERSVEADARQRIRELQEEGRAQMRALEAKRREATQLLGRLSAAAGESWQDITTTAHPPPARSQLRVNHRRAQGPDSAGTPQAGPGPAHPW